MSSQPSGLKTPTSHGFMPLPLGTPGAGQPTVGVTVGDTIGANAGMGFGLHEPPKMRKAMKGDGSKTPVGGSPPGGGLQDQQYQSENTRSTGTDGTTTPHHSGHSPRGTLTVKLISARGLAVSHSPEIQPQPYVVMQFEQNEFVSRPPKPTTSHTSVPFTTAQAQPMSPGNLTRSQSGLGVGTITRAFAEAVGRSKGKREEASGLQTPQAEELAGGSWLGKPGPGDPVWKEEVSL